MLLINLEIDKLYYFANIIKMSNSKNNQPTIKINNQEIEENSDDSFERKLEKMKSDLEELESGLASKHLTGRNSWSFKNLKETKLETFEDWKYIEDKTMK